MKSENQEQKEKSCYRRFFVRIRQFNSSLGSFLQQATNLHVAKLQRMSILYFLDRSGCFKGNWNIFLTSINCRSDLLTDWPNKRAKTLNYYYRQWLARRNTASWSTHETDTIHSRSHTHGMGAGFFFKERKRTYTGAAFLWIFSLLLAPRLAVIINLWTGMSRDGTLSLWVRLVHH